MPTVLVVDDLESDRHLIEQYLSKRQDIAVEFADGGVTALERIFDSAPDLVLTDLQMPGMDGLQLVSAIRSRFPQIPTVLITGHGSELTAVEALRRGAASYVPKSHLADRLLSTLDEILLLTKAERTGGGLIKCLDGADFDFALPNDPELIPQLVDLLQQMVAGVGLCDETSRLRVGVALEEALINAMYHGNLEITAAEIEQTKANLLEKQSMPLAQQRRSQPPFKDRRVVVRAEISSSEARFVIRDQGPGFDLSSVPDPAFPGGMDRHSGRGLLLMESFMDEISFNKNGTEVVMVKHRDTGLAVAVPPDDADESLFVAARRDDSLVLTPLRNIGSLAEPRVQQELAYLLEHLDEPGVQNIVVDLVNVKYFGSSMLEALRMLRVRANERGGLTAACNVSQTGHDILSLARFDSHWPIYNSIEEALGSVSRGGAFSDDNMSAKQELESPPYPDT